LNEGHLLTLAALDFRSMSSASPSIQTIDTGSGRIVSRSHGSFVVFSELSSTYPLKLLSPQITQDGVALVYILSYGGGLVGGDSVKLSVEAGSGTVLVLLSQGSTKVFKARPGGRASGRPNNARSLSSGPITTAQTMDVLISPNSGLFLLPDPVTCFRSASYNQIQTFRLSGDSASVVLLDWVTSGRKALGEDWVFARYYSMIEIWVGGKRIARDVLLLEDPIEDTKPLPRRSLSDRLAPYSCYATLILYGPLVENVIRDVNTEYKTISVLKTNTPSDLIWSVSALSEEKGCVVRVAGKSTEGVKNWLGNALRKLENVIGIDVYRRAFPP